MLSTVRVMQPMAGMAKATPLQPAQKTPVTAQRQDEYGGYAGA